MKKNTENGCKVTATPRGGLTQELERYKISNYQSFEF